VTLDARLAEAASGVVFTVSVEALQSGRPQAPRLPRTGPPGTASSVAAAGLTRP